jgi:hypothetical protein
LRAEHDIAKEKLTRELHPMNDDQVKHNDEVMQADENLATLKEAIASFKVLQEVKFNYSADADLE